MRVAILSDTHVPSRADAVPEWVLDEVRAADHVLHAGDFDSPDAYEETAAAASELTAVVGNLDPANLGLPDVATVELSGVQFVLTHGHGEDPTDVSSYEADVAAVVDDHAADDLPTVGISGHTHQQVDTTVDGYRIINPGSATGAAPATETTMVVADVEDGEIDATVLEG